MSELRAGLIAQVVIQEEPWAGIWPEARALAEAHADEVDGGVEPRRPWRPDTEMLAMLNAAGSFKIWGARNSFGELLGYITWTVQLDPESLGLLIAQMGPWYAAPGSHCGGKLFDVSILGLKALGVQLVFPHHRTQGRGSDLGPFFKLRGAQHTQNNYQLWIGE